MHGRFAAERVISVALHCHLCSIFHCHPAGAPRNVDPTP
jgi:hypothetical protein